MMRSRTRRALPAIVAAACFLVATVFVLVAVDVHGWQRRVARDDVRFRALHSHVGLWQSPATLPGDPARVLLGLGEPIAYRRAVQLFWFSHIGSQPLGTRDLMTIRTEAQSQLEQLMGTGRSPLERSTAANLLGVMTVTTPTTDTETQAQTLRRAAGYFQRAIAEYPANFAAKQNLELVLRLRRPGKSRFGKDARGGFGFGRGRGVGVVGSGY
jgi:hypothetical protein